MKTLSIIIVNWNAGKYLLNCINSILKSNKKEFELDKIIIVDNASKDNSLEQLPVSSLIHIVKNQLNLGFAQACCIGANLCSSDLLLFLNPDTLLLDDTLDKSVLFYKMNFIAMNFGILGIQLKYENGYIQKSCARFPNFINYLSDSFGVSKLIPSLSMHMTNFNHQESRFVNHVIGAYYLLKNDIYKNIKGFDTDYFLYLEDLDLSLRAHKVGVNSYFWVGTNAIHIGGGCSNSIKAERIFYSINSRMLYAKKHFSLISRYITLMSTLCVEPFTRSIFCIIKGDLKGVRETITGYKMVFANLFNKNIL